VRRVTGVPGFGMPRELQSKRLSTMAAYAALVSVGIFGSMGWQWFADLAATVARHTSGHELSLALYVAWALVIAGSMTLALRAVGPLAMTRPALTWCLGSPTISELLHRRSLRSRTQVAVVAAGLAGIAATILWPVSGWPVRLFTMVGAVLVGPALVAITAAEQAEAPTEGYRGGYATTQAIGTAGVAIGLLVWYAASFGLITLGATEALGLVGAVAVVITALGLRHRRRARDAISTGAISLGELHRAGDVVERVEMSVVMLTAVPLEPTPQRRRPIRFAVSARLIRGRVGWLALLDVRRVLARWPVLVVIAGLVPLVGSVTRVAGHAWGCVVLTVLAYYVASRLARSLFAWNASPSLKFLVPFGEASTMVTLLAAPVLGVLAFSTAAVGLAGLSLWWIGSSLACALLGIRRLLLATRNGADFDLVMSTPMGALPVNLVLRLVSGWDVAVLGGLLSAVLPDSAVLPVVVISGLLSAAWATGRTAWTNRRRATIERPWPRRARPEPGLSASRRTTKPSRPVP